MFSFVSEGVNYPADEEETVGKRLYELNISKEDYFYSIRSAWDEITTDVYQFDFGGGEIVSFPSGFYVMIADVFGHVDWIPIDEIINRDMEVLVLSNDFSAWTLKAPKLVGYEESVVFYWPMTKNPVPLTNDGGKLILLASRMDQHKATKEKYVDMFVS